MKEITYSFIIPHKNTPELLNRCIRSIPQREDVEIIVVDDNSDENRKPYYDSINIEIVELSKDISSGAGNARNKGIERAHGKWLLFADADDFYNVGFLAVLDKYVDSDVDVVYFNHQVIKDEKVIRNPYPFIDNYRDRDNIDIIKFYFNVAWNKMVRRDYLHKYQIQFETCPVGNDIFFSYQVGYFTENNIIETTRIYNYNIHEGSTIHRKKNGKEFYLTLFNHHYQCNEFYCFIGHPEWRRRLVGKFLAILIKRGFRESILSARILFHNWSEIKKSKHLFVKSINDRAYA